MKTPSRQPHIYFPKLLYPVNIIIVVRRPLRFDSRIKQKHSTDPFPTFIAQQYFSIIKVLLGNNPQDCPLSAGSQTGLFVPRAEYSGLEGHNSSITINVLFRLSSRLQLILFET